MKLAEGSKSWLLSSSISGVILLILSIILLTYTVSYVLFLVSIFLFLLTIFFLVFFRDPDRKIGSDIVSPADGKIRKVSEIKDKDVGDSILISIFMNVNNVHVNRMPFDGKVVKITHKKGSHIPAFKKESERNERTIILFDSKIGRYKLVLIAGTLARRIVSYIKKDDVIKKGNRISIIRLGSRVDIFLPKKSIKKTFVKYKDKIKAGEDTIAKIND